MNHDDSAVLALRANQVTRRRGRRSVLNNATAEFLPGVTSILGPNGAGKTTLISILAGVDGPSEGTTSLVIRGREIDGRGRGRHIGWLPQSFGYPPRMKVIDFVRYAAWLKEVPSRRADSAVDDAIEATDVGEVATRRMSQLSGGTLRRVGLAAATVHSPEVLLLDEPTAGLDPLQRANFHAMVRSRAGDSVVVLATHLLEDVNAVADAVTVLSDGSISWQGTPKELASMAQNRGGSEMESLREGLLGIIDGATQ